MIFVMVIKASSPSTVAHYCICELAVAAKNIGGQEAAPSYPGMLQH